ncbi:MAG: hypothetical protein KIT58_06305 [Planctomycetota bacterium]|nr:hypothetical protein [Planctomycetota bacterium]
MDRAQGDEVRQTYEFEVTERVARGAVIRVTQSAGHGGIGATADVDLDDNGVLPRLPGRRSRVDAEARQEAEHDTWKE